MAERANHAADAMTLGRELPPHVKLMIQGRLGSEIQPEVFALADITASGQFGQAWVAVADGHLAVADLNNTQGPDFRLVELSDAVETEIVEGIGASRFRVVVDGKLAEELRFSRRQAKRFSRLNRQVTVRTRGADAGGESGGQDGSEPDDRFCETCHRLIPEWAQACPQCLHKRRILWRLLDVAMAYRGWLFVGIGAAILHTLTRLVPPWVSKCMIDDVLTSSPHQRPELLWPLIGILAVTIVAQAVLGYLRLNRMAKLSERIEADLRERAFAQLQKLSLAFYAKRPTGQLISRITHDTSRLWEFVAFGVVEMGISLVMIVGIAVMLLLQDWRLALLALLPLPVAALLTYAHTQTMRRMLRPLWAKYSRMTSILGDVIPGVRVVKAFTQEDREVDRFTQRSKALADDAIALHGQWTMYWPKIWLILNAGSLLIWAFASPKIVRGDDPTMTVGRLVMVLGYLWMLYGPIEAFGMWQRMFQRAVTSAQRVFEVLDTQPDICNKVDAIAPPRIQGRVALEGVCFSYDGVKRVLEDVSLTVEPGEMIGLAGRSGAGKSTLINLMARFYDVTEGRITIDGVDIRDLDLHAMRSQIGIVLQEPYLFCGTVAENIAYGHPSATMQQIITAARAANAHDFIVGFADGYDTMVGERGQTLSGGERQRISIARAILNNPRILILDEATSSVDSKTEMKIQEAIDRLVHGRTTFAIAHRLSTLRKADRLVILEHGKLVEQGTHDELVAKEGGLYAELHKTQVELQSMFAA